ncbi:hypothetical protein CYME_CMD155C [Cyanidioschyzon merolae strain 10D]|jgi:hypothetical protein|uniref:Uncharacterized protein n=1 Tax=Cyanidioschyzon merolae (strain NIES-3377 / 10D) TaxID=280699 RepID=M1UP68_CYAM1|nr:hypothetical protein CYME_CMD155C [Cyanidioschyzon merolae strain 10D]BAM79216.1 hypothetical protein CYME_CMD155C [Cyanidioschyzon merolae strain 10D]|eukprot:XP_005535502.1 hypothetical protein CYME_CMD155C [Cyanidioschyzon merolae strain 10D]
MGATGGQASAEDTRFSLRSLEPFGQPTRLVNKMHPALKHNRRFSEGLYGEKRKRQQVPAETKVKRLYRSLSRATSACLRLALGMAVQSSIRPGAELPADAVQRRNG